MNRRKKEGILRIMLILTVIILITLAYFVKKEEVKETGAFKTPDLQVTGGSTPVPTSSPAPTVSPAPTSTPTPTVSPAPTSTPTPTPLPYKGEASDYASVLIAAVYGTGTSNSDALLSNGYVQLYNTADSGISLYGASLYYKSGSGAYEEFAFAREAVIPAKGYYLVRAASPHLYDRENAVLGIEYFDDEWDVYIDNHEISLMFGPACSMPSADDDITRLTDAVSVFIASEEGTDSVYAVEGMTKNKIAVRTALTEYSGYHLENLKKRTSSDLKRLCTVTSDGTVNSVLSVPLNEVTFSCPPGIYGESISLELSAKEGYTVFYTTDGSDPCVSGQEYNGAIVLEDSSLMPWGPAIKAWEKGKPSAERLPGGYVIKAYATDGINQTDVFTNTYFIMPELSAYGVTVMSVSAELGQMFGADGFYSNFNPTGNISDPSPRGSAVLEVFRPEGTRVGYSRVELAVNGHGSAGKKQKSLRIYYKGYQNEDAGLYSNLYYDLFEGAAVNENGEAITEFSRLLLRNSGNDCGSSYIRDAYMQRVSSPLNTDIMASAPVLVFVNGEFWGVYNARERYSPEYFESHYGINKENIAIVENDYSRVHTDKKADYIVSAGKEGDADDFNELADYIRSHDLSVSENYGYVCERMDVDSFIDMWVARLFFNARDWPENNVKAWRNTNPQDPSGYDTRWRFVLLDMDMGLSFYTDANDTSEAADIFWSFNYNSVCSCMMMALMENREFKTRFLLRYHEVVTELYTPEYLSGVLEQFLEERDALAELQEMRWSSDGASVSVWNREAEKIRTFIQNRTAYAMKACYRYFGIDETYYSRESLNE